MISKETAYRIYACHCEISNAEALLDDIKKVSRNHLEYPRDAFGRVQTHLELGVPSGNGKRLFRVSNELAPSVIRAHIAQMQADLLAACEAAVLEAQP